MENRLSQCRSVLRYSREIAASVLAGVTSLSEALQKVETDRTQANGNEARFDRLRRLAPDLAELIAEERMSLGVAYAAWNQRETERRGAYLSGVSSVDRLNDFVGHVAAIIGGEEARIESEPHIIVKPEFLQNAQAAVNLLEKFCKRQADDSKSH